LPLLIDFKAGIDSGYVKKPCLDPYDPECPNTAPNFRSKKVIIPVVFKKPVTDLHEKGMAILAFNRIGGEKLCSCVNCAEGDGNPTEVGRRDD